MLCFVSLESRWRRNERMRYCVRARSVWRIDSLRFRFGLLLLVFALPRSAAEAARSSIVSIWGVQGYLVSFSFFRSLIDTILGYQRHTCLLTLFIMRSINAVGHGRSSDTARSATQERVRSWWSSEVDAGAFVWSRSTEARMSSMSMLNWGDCAQH